jgi:hypothetical protein
MVKVTEIVPPSQWLFFWQNQKTSATKTMQNLGPLADSSRIRDGAECGSTLAPFTGRWSWRNRRNPTFVRDIRQPTPLNPGRICKDDQRQKRTISVGVNPLVGLKGFLSKYQS